MRPGFRKLLLSTLIAATLFGADDAVFQMGTYDGLRAGAYEGVNSWRRLKRFGNFGIGTVDGLDGEMVVLGGIAYQVRTDGRPSVVDESASIPFAMLTPFRADVSFQVSQTVELKDLQKQIDALLPSPNYIYAVRVTGDFKWLDTRSVNRQARPYPTLEEALKGQVVFRLGSISGTMVGFRFPAYVGGVNNPGYHFHFLASDLQAGGHLLDAALEKGKIEIGRYTEWRMVLPETEGFRQAGLQ